MENAQFWMKMEMFMGNYLLILVTYVDVEWESVVCALKQLARIFEANWAVVVFVHVDEYADFELLGGTRLPRPTALPASSVRVHAAPIIQNIELHGHCIVCIEPEVRTLIIKLKTLILRLIVPWLLVLTRWT